jgi:hypothetical protein
MVANARANPPMLDTLDHGAAGPEAGRIEPCTELHRHAEPVG